MSECSSINTIKGLIVGLLIGGLTVFIAKTIYDNVISVDRLGKNETEYTITLNSPLKAAHLAFITNVLKNNNVKIKGICALDTPSKKAVIKIITNNPEKAEEAFKKSNLPIIKSTVELKEFDDICDITKSFHHAKIDIASMYSMDDNYMAIKKK